MSSSSYGVRLRVWGEFALFSRPEMRVERVSYEALTPSAARGVLDAIYWKPSITWVIDRIHVLAPIRFTSLRRNEVREKIPAGSVKRAMKAGRGQLGLYVDEGDNRQQRASLLLRDVDYLIEAHFVMHNPDDHPGKHLDMFNRRARRGQCFHQPYFGCREFPVSFALVEPGEEPVSRLPPEDRNRDLGLMLHDLDFANGMQPHFFHAVLKSGIISVPPLPTTEEGQR